jgi:hypothetical protein
MLLTEGNKEREQLLRIASGSSAGENAKGKTFPEEVA